MALSDTKQFLQDLLTNYDPDLDVTPGSRIDTEIIEPILERVGSDPFDEDIATFVKDRIIQSFPNLAITEADDLSDTLIDPFRVLIEPVVREIKLVKLRSSLRNVESLSDDEVDALMGNFFEARKSGGYAIGVVRIYFATPQSVTLTLVNPAQTRTGMRFYPTRTQQITVDQMLLNIEGSEYYFDVNYTSEKRGDEYNVEPGEIISVGNIPTSTRVKNLRRFRNGTPREVSVDYVGRVQSSIGDKTLTVERGVIATLYEAFPALKRLFVVGFQDPEMMRDIITGGSLGPMPDPDIYGNFFGLGMPIDDINADTTSGILEATTGAFTSRVGAVGDEPTSWYVTLIYVDPATTLPVAVDAQILRVVSNTRVLTDHEMPLTLGADSVTWMLRQKKLTISDIPGGIVLPDTADGTLEIETDSVHIGGKTDVYVAGETEVASAQINRLTDESPIAKGLNAETGTPVNVVTLHDVGIDPALITPGMSLVLEEGVDANSYLILVVTVVGSDVDLTLNLDMTGAQANLSWKVVDDIDVELTDPKNIKIEGSDLLTSAGSDTVSTSGASNFLDAAVEIDDILEINAELGGGDFTITDVFATTIKVTPDTPRTISGASYRIFTRSGAVETPLVRVSSMELLDSSGAPSGTVIPYRDPVLAISKAFQNEGSGYIYEDLVIAGLVSGGLSGSLAIGGQDIDWAAFNPESCWGSLILTTFTFSAGNKTPTQIAAEINADPTFDSYGVKATVLSYGGLEYIGIYSPYVINFTGGSAMSTLGMLTIADRRTSSVRGISEPFYNSRVRNGDLIEFLDGNNSGVTGRVIADAATATTPIRIGYGPLGPPGTEGLYFNLSLRPDVGCRARLGRPSVGSARVYYPGPTSAEFDFAETKFTVERDNQVLVYIPDPENTRTLHPAPPTTDLPNDATTTAPQTLTDPDADFLLARIQKGDILEVLYRPITGTSPLPTPGNVLVGGKALVLRLDTDPFITVSFPYDMVRQDVVDYINEQVGETIALLATGGELMLQFSRRIEIDTDPTVSTILVGDELYLAGAASTTDHPDRGSYPISRVQTANNLLISSSTPFLTPSVLKTGYRIKRYLQRISSTEMNDNVDASALYYADIQLISAGPGDHYNIPSGLGMDVTGNRGDGYRLETENETTSFSRAEVLRARISPTILLVGSSDSPEEYVPLSQQNVQVNYERSQLVDEIQSFCDSDYQRVVNEEILVRHLLPHYVSLNWSYVGGNSEPDMKKALFDFLDAVEANVQLEVTDLTDVIRRRQATSVFTPDPESQTSRTAPLFVVIYHDALRRIRGMVVTDYVDTVRTQRFIPDSVVLSRVSTGGIR